MVPTSTGKPGKMGVQLPVGEFYPIYLKRQGILANIFSLNFN